MVVHHVYQRVCAAVYYNAYHLTRTLSFRVDFHCSVLHARVKFRGVNKIEAM